MIGPTWVMDSSLDSLGQGSFIDGATWIYGVEESSSKENEDTIVKKKKRRDAAGSQTACHIVVVAAAIAVPKSEKD